jgi:hypothetical protein
MITDKTALLEIKTQGYSSSVDKNNIVTTSLIVFMVDPKGPSTILQDAAVDYLKTYPGTDTVVFIP